MRRKRTALVWICCIILWLTGQNAWAATEGGAEPVRAGQSDIYAGVVVDYMGKLQFLVLDQDSGNPIPEASIEIYIPSLNRYVLIGLTDEHGIRELDVAYSRGQGTAEGEDLILYLTDNKISYRVYKDGWRPYPRNGETILESKEVPQVVTVYLYQKNGGDDDSDVDPSPGTHGGDDLPDNYIELPDGGNIGLDAGKNPKTGVGSAMPYWMVGLLFFLLAGGTAGYLLIKDKEMEQKERR